MSNFSSEISWLQKEGLLPDADYFTASRFAAQYENTKQFWGGVAAPMFAPIINGFTVGIYAVRAIWATLRAIGNLLIAKPKAAGDSFVDICSYTTLALCLGVMAPIHVLTYAIELLTRTVASWFAKESVADLSSFSFKESFAKEAQASEELLPSSNYLTKARFLRHIKMFSNF